MFCEVPAAGWATGLSHPPKALTQILLLMQISSARAKLKCLPVFQFLILLTTPCSRNLEIRAV